MQIKQMMKTTDMMKIMKITMQVKMKKDDEYVER